MEQNKMYRYYQATILIFIILFMLLGWQSCQDSRKKSELSTLNEALKDSLKVSRNAEGLSQGKIKVLTTQVADDFINLATKDTSILKLQKLVAKNKSHLKPGGSATIIGSETTVDVSVPILPPTIDTTSGKEVPTASPFNLKGWVWGSITMKKDSLNKPFADVSLKVRNEYDLVLGFDKKKWYSLSKAVPYADVTAKNPYTDIKELRTYSVSMPAADQIHIGLGVFYGIGADLKPQPFIGVGVMWTPISF